MNTKLMLAVEEHPQAFKLVTAGLVILAAYNLSRAVRLHHEVTAHLAQIKSDAARAASEALGG